MPSGNLPGITGRNASILALIVGVVLLVIGFATGPNYMLVLIGALFFVIGLVLLIVSLKTRGAAD
jgi:membrane protein implicated in regulation of membrane protease activity